jgi:hypothetical protein
MDFALAQMLRRGVIPGCCGGAAACYAFYAVQVARAANEWKALAMKEDASSRETNTAALKRSSGNGRSASSTEKEFALYQAQALGQHAGTCAALSLTSLAIAVEATRDWQSYRRLRTLDDMERSILGKGKKRGRQGKPNMRRLFFVRNSVLVTAILSFGVVEYYMGRVRLFYWP